MNSWPELAVSDWEDTRDALQRRLQIIGKLTLAGAAAQNHWWHVPLRLSARGLHTGLLRAPRSGPFHVAVDLLDHHLLISTATEARRVELVPEPLNRFYASFSAALADLDIELETLPRPVEVPDPATPFAEEEGFSAYDAEAVTTFWQLLVSVDRVFDSFGSRFVGKASRPGLWWGGMDYAAGRWSGRPAPPHPGGAPNVADWVMQEGYSHEVAAYGYFAAGAPEGALYAYTYPTPTGYTDQPVPSDVSWSDELGEWLLPYHVIRESKDPDARLLEFLQATYDAAATTASWSRELERSDGIPAHISQPDT